MRKIFLLFMMSCFLLGCKKLAEESNLTKITESSTIKANSANSVNLDNEESSLEPEEITIYDPEGAKNPDQTKIWCCNSKGHTDPAWDNCNKQITFNNYDECYKHDKLHKETYPGHNSGCE